ncbi:hypothetical protein N9D37_01030 [Erythrobacter sp.]|nr:hypothetical protein [Erythrobacter sp.]
MRIFALVFLTALSGCSKVENTFIVKDTGLNIDSANLELCNSLIPLQRSGDRWSVTTPIDCKEAGQIRLHYASSEEEICIVDYVTPDADQSIEFRVTENGCEVYNHFVS